MLNGLKRLIGSNWVELNWAFYRVMTNPRVVTLVLLAMMALLLLGQFPKWRKRLLRGLAIALGIYWLVISPPVAALAVHGLLGFVPKDAGTTADAIVVLGRGSQEEGNRYPIGLELLQANRAPNIFITGRRNIEDVAELMQQVNLPLTQLKGSRCGRTTYEEAWVTATILGPQGVQTLLLVSDEPHMLRAWLTFQAEGFTVIPYPIPLPSWLSSARRSMLTLREYPGLLSYALLGRFRQDATTTLNAPNPERIAEVERRGCEVSVVEAG